MSNSRFVCVTYIRTTPEKLWQALIDPEFTRQYWSSTWQESEWKPGSPWRLLAPDGRVFDEGKIIEFKPCERLVLTWQHQVNAKMKAEGFSRLTYTLERVKTCVKLTLVHEIDLPESELIKAVSTGWPAILSSLKTLLETGDPIEEFREWPKGV